MPSPSDFSWIDKPLLAAMARPDDRDELEWLRRQGIDVLITLTEDPLRRDWIDDVGLLAVHVPVIDMEPPTSTQIDHCITTITKANAREMGVGVHCAAGKGRTGVIIACYYVHQGEHADAAIDRIRKLRPGSIETDEQADAVMDYARRLRGAGSRS
jgi:atypical dual specificity phosphatase